MATACSFSSLFRWKKVQLLWLTQTMFHNTCCYFVQLILLKVEKWLSPPWGGKVSPKEPLMEMMLAYMERDPVHTHHYKPNPGGDWTSKRDIQSTLSPSPTEKTVAMKGSMVLRSTLEIPSMTMATPIPGNSTICLILDLQTLPYLWKLQGKIELIIYIIYWHFPVSFTRCAVISSIAAGSSTTFVCNGMEGQYVNIVIPGRKEYLTLCEVEVTGTESDADDPIEYACDWIWNISSCSCPLNFKANQTYFCLFSFTITFKGMLN